MIHTSIKESVYHMKCFHHHNESAVCSCNICLKGLCPQCAQTFSGKNYSACSNECAQTIRKRNKVSNYAIKLYGISEDDKPQKAGLRLGITDISIGLVFSILGSYSIIKYNDIDAFSTFFMVCGVIFMLRGIGFIKKVK